jgi:hypothetical protein
VLSVAVKVTGSQRVLNKLAELRQSAQTTIPRRANREAAQILLAEAYRRSPHRTGKLRRSGRLRDTGEGTFVEFTAGYAEPVEHGHRLRNGKFHPGVHFLRDAELATRQRRLNRYETVVKREIAARAK